MRAFFVTRRRSIVDAALFLAGFELAFGLFNIVRAPLEAVTSQNG